MKAINLSALPEHVQDRVLFMRDMGCVEVYVRETRAHGWEVLPYYKRGCKGVIGGTDPHAGVRIVEGKNGSTS